MKTNLVRASNRILIRMAEGTKIIIHHVTIANPVTDALSQTITGTKTAKQKIIRGLFHEIGPATSGLRVYSEIQIGDAIIDIPPETELSDLKEVEFEINGRRWVQKEVGRDLSQAWDVIWSDQRVTRTMLLTKKTQFK